MKAIIKKLGQNGICEVWRMGGWRYVKYFDGTGWWQWNKAWAKKQVNHGK